MSWRRMVGIFSGRLKPAPRTSGPPEGGRRILRLPIQDQANRGELLLHHREIGELARATAERGTTLVPLRLYFKDHRVKILLGVARGKRTYDKRRVIAERDAMFDSIRIEP